LRLWPQVGIAPSSIRIKITIKIVPNISALLQEKCRTQSVVFSVVAQVTAFCVL